MNIKKTIVVISVVSLLGVGYFKASSPVFGGELNVQASANPSIGEAPLLDVDVNISVSGNATGPVTYKIDCTSDGQWERNITLSSTSYSAPDLCDYQNEGEYKITVFVARGGLSYATILTVLVQNKKTLFINAAANPSSGQAPLNDVDVTISVSGSATGPVTYKIDCTSDGQWERNITLSSTTYEALDLCDYPTAANYAIKARVERDGLFYETSLPIIVFAQKTLFVELTANPSSGTEPLQDVDLTATVSGTATGPITYKFDCTADGSWDYTITSSSNPYTALNLCDYATAGTYTAKVEVGRENLNAQDTQQIEVQRPQTLHLSITANPSSGHAPLEDVDLIASISGNSAGSITYKFDCENDGIWEKTITTDATSYTAANLCDYATEGVYTIKVLAERNGMIIQGTGNIVVGETANLALEVVATPSFGEKQLLDVDLTAYLSGTATGPITYKFDCTADGSWEKTVITSANSYTAFDLCDYPDPGTYKAKVSVERNGLAVIGTTVIFVSPPQ